ncbi:MAG: tRNA preQ1(34) S-adenosylmethionine ribosyltransferase-isomerase QueA [Planctomycetes bacterium]|nr:tRNA preQ1(34) S-adenosylmethionine ribosyltransferase-isomerase QueA [Planctomycetota bacterium]
MDDLLELLASYDYALPEERIAQEPCAERSEARMLLVPGGHEALGDASVTDLPGLLREGDLLVFNDTRVRAARLEGVRCSSGGRAELLVLDHDQQTMRALLKTRGTPVIGERFEFAEGALILKHVRELGDGLHELGHVLGDELAALLEVSGRMPLPPYIRRARHADPRDAMDRERYQTLFAQVAGAAAAPTAGLHFTPTLLQRCTAAGVQHAFVTLHVGLGTFKPITAERLADHLMHEEVYTVPQETVRAVDACRARGGRVIPVGTTALRALEAASANPVGLTAHSGSTRLFIRPGYEFRCADLLFTNFHAPRSTLLVLVSAYCGRERIRAAYEHALANAYRFLSYGDACLLSPTTAGR